MNFKLAKKFIEFGCGVVGSAERKKAWVKCKELTSLEQRNKYLHLTEINGQIMIQYLLLSSLYQKKKKKIQRFRISKKQRNGVSWKIPSFRLPGLRLSPTVVIFFPPFDQKSFPNQGIDCSRWNGIHPPSDRIALRTMAKLNAKSPPRFCLSQKC